MRQVTGWIALAGLALLIGAPTVAAQDVSGGLLGGVNLASLANANYDAERRIGLRAGGFLDVGLAPAWSARIEAAYSMKGVEPEGSGATVALDYVEVPVLALFRIGAGTTAPVLLTGPSMGFKVVSEFRADDGSTFDYRDSVPGFDVGWVLGGGFETSLGGTPVLLDARYTRGLRSVFDFGPDDADSDDKNDVISVGVSAAFF